MVVAKPIADLAIKPPAANLSVIDKVLSNQLTQDEAWQFSASVPEIVAFTLLALQQRLLQAQQATGPNTPSVARPAFLLLRVCHTTVAVMIRKNSYCNHSDRGALTQSVLMTIFRTLKVRKLQPLDTILKALADYSRTRKLPPLPALITLEG